MEKELYEKSQEALKALYNAIVELLKEKPTGMSNNQISSCLGLESEQDGAQKNYLVYSLLGNLMSEGIIEKIKDKRFSFYRLKKQ